MLLFIVLLIDLLLLSSFTDTGFCSFVWHNEYFVYVINEEIKIQGFFFHEKKLLSWDQEMQSLKAVVWHSTISNMMSIVPDICINQTHSCYLPKRVCILIFISSTWIVQKARIKCRSLQFAVSRADFNLHGMIVPVFNVASHMIWHTCALCSWRILVLTYRLFFCPCSHHRW